MKLTINFIETPMRKIGIFGYLLLLINLIALAAIAYFRISAQEFEIDNNKLLVQVTELKHRVSLLKESSKGLPNIKKLADLRDDINRINSILVKHVFDANSVLEAIEQDAPKHVYLQQLKHDSKTGKITLRAISTKNNRLTELLKKLERDKLFKQVSLLRRDNIKEAGKLFHRVEIELEQIKIASGKV